MNISHPVPARLIDCALTLFASGGETALTTRAVCGMAGVTAPTLYHHFGTLDGLLNAAFFERFVITIDLETGRAWAVAN